MRKMMLALTVAAGCMAAAGCAKHVRKDWKDVSWNRAGARVELGYHYDRGEIPATSDRQALQLAKKRCQSWGYADVEASGRVSYRCHRAVITSSAGPECVEWLGAKEYQCLVGDETRPIE